MKPKAVPDADGIPLMFLATGNEHKVREFANLAAASSLGVRVLSAADAGGMPPVEETGRTFEENACMKARAVAKAVSGRGWVMADDSGLCVDALGGAPGVHSARFAGAQADDSGNLRRLIREIENVPASRRGAAFVCALALISPGGEEFVFEGAVRGTLLSEPRGTGGFGYDPIFVPEGGTKTFAELPPDEKNRLSHRSRAWSRLAAWWKLQRE